MNAPASPALYRRAGVRARSDSPSVAQLEAEGWMVVHVDPRWGTALMRKAEECSPNLGSTDEDEASELAL